MKKVILLAILTSLTFMSCAQNNDVDLKKMVESQCAPRIKQNLVEYYKMAIETEAYIKLAKDDYSKKIALKKYNDLIRYLEFKYNWEIESYASNYKQAAYLLKSNKDILGESIKIRTKAGCFFEAAADARAKLDLIKK